MRQGRRLASSSQERWESPPRASSSGHPSPCRHCGSSGCGCGGTATQRHLVPPHRWFLIPRGHFSSLPAKAGAAQLSCCVRKGGVACWLQRGSAAGGDGLTLRLMREPGKWLRHRLRGVSEGSPGARCSLRLSWRLRHGPLGPVGPAGQKPSVSVKRCSRKTLGMWEMGSHRVPEPLLWEAAYKKRQRGVKS